MHFLNLIVKTKLRTNKATQVLELREILEIGLPNWAGELFKEYEERMMASLPQETIISTHRGTRGIKASMYPKTQRTNSISGLRISTARGTAVRTL